VRVRRWFCGLLAGDALRDWRARFAFSSLVYAKVLGLTAAAKLAGFCLCVEYFGSFPCWVWRWVIGSRDACDEVG